MWIDRFREFSRRDASLKDVPHHMIIGLQSYRRPLIIRNRGPWLPLFRGMVLIQYSPGKENRVLVKITRAISHEKVDLHKYFSEDRS